MIRVILSLFAVILLVGCASQPATQEVRVVHAMSYPNLPDIKPVQDPELIPWKHDVPRDMSTLSVIDSESCKSVPESAHNEQFWERCGIHPPLKDSNIFVGFDLDNWNIILEDFAKLRETIYQYKSRIIEINNQRQEWRAKAESSENKFIDDSEKIREESKVPATSIK